MLTWTIELRRGVVHGPSSHVEKRLSGLISDVDPSGYDTVVAWWSYRYYPTAPSGQSCVPCRPGYADHTDK